MDVLATLRRALERTDADPRRLTVELTETALLDDRERAAAFARHLRRVGCHVALDDFGAGYSFARIKDVPADVLKIDRQFVADIVNDPASESVIKAILAFASDMGMLVVAEGVEDHETAHRLGELGVRFLQGYHFERPAPLDHTTPRQADP